MTKCRGSLRGCKWSPELPECGNPAWDPSLILALLVCKQQLQGDLAEHQVPVEKLQKAARSLLDIQGEPAPDHGHIQETTGTEQSSWQGGLGRGKTSQGGGKDKSLLGEFGGKHTAVCPQGMCLHVGWDVAACVVSPCLAAEFGDRDLSSLRVLGELSEHLELRATEHSLH